MKRKKRRREHKKYKKQVWATSCPHSHQNPLGALLPEPIKINLSESPPLEKMPWFFHLVTLHPMSLSVPSVSNVLVQLVRKQRPHFLKGSGLYQIFSLSKFLSPVCPDLLCPLLPPYGCGPDSSALPSPCLSNSVLRHRNWSN